MVKERERQLLAELEEVLASQRAFRGVQINDNVPKTSHNKN